MKHIRTNALGLALMIGCCLADISASAADCAAEQQARDNSAYSSYVASTGTAQSNYDTKLAQNAIAATESQQYCTIALDFALGSCATMGNVARTTASTTYNTSISNCSVIYTNQASIDKCICLAHVDYDYAVNMANANETKCRADAYNTYYKCTSLATATQNRDNALAYSDFIYETGQANATYNKLLTQSSYTATLCYIRESIIAYNAALDADCATNPANCCVNACIKAYNNAYLAAQSAFLNTVGPAEGQRVYAQMMCSTVQSRDDQNTYAMATYRTAQVDAQYNYDMTAAANVYQHALDTHAAQYAKDLGICACTRTNQTEYETCVSTAYVVKQGNDDLAWAAYNIKCEMLANERNAAIAVINSEAQADYASHQVTAQNCYQNAQNAFNAIYDAASAAYNAAMQAAGESFNRCIEACNNNG